MGEVDALRAAVTSRYAARDLPEWPDPWPDREPDDAAYSRLTDPSRYTILHRRTDDWLAVLAEVAGLAVEPVDGLDLRSRGDHPVARVRRLVSDRRGARPLSVLERDESMPAVAFALGEPEVILEEQPDCGCDACDGGSEGLLRVVDDLFVEVLTSPVVVLRGADGRWDARWSHHTQQAGGRPGIPRTFHELMAQCARLADGKVATIPEGTRVWVSQPLLGRGGGGGPWGVT